MCKKFMCPNIAVHLCGFNLFVFLSFAMFLFLFVLLMIIPEIYKVFTAKER